MKQDAEAINSKTISAIIKLVSEYEIRTGQKVKELSYTASGNDNGIATSFGVSLQILNEDSK